MGTPVGAGNSTKQRVGRPFEKGKSGNPSGRPKVNFELQHLARAQTGPAVKALIDALQDDKQRVSAASVLLAYGWGKPTQTTEISGPQGSPLSILIDLSGKP